MDNASCYVAHLYLWYDIHGNHHWEKFLTSREMEITCHYQITLSFFYTVLKALSNAAECMNWHNYVLSSYLFQIVAFHCSAFTFVTQKYCDIVSKLCNWSMMSVSIYKNTFSMLNKTPDYVKSYMTISWNPYHAFINDLFYVFQCFKQKVYEDILEDAQWQSKNKGKLFECFASC